MIEKKLASEEAGWYQWLAFADGEGESLAAGHLIGALVPSINREKVSLVYRSWDPARVATLATEMESATEEYHRGLADADIGFGFSREERESRRAAAVSFWDTAIRWLREAALHGGVTVLFSQEPPDLRDAGRAVMLVDYDWPPAAPRPPAGPAGIR